MGGFSFGRSSIGGVNSTGVPVGRDPGWEEFCGRNHIEGPLFGRNPNGNTSNIILILPWVTYS